MKRCDILFVFMLEIMMLIVGVWFGKNIAQEQQQTITKAACIQLFNNL